MDKKLVTEEVYFTGRYGFLDGPLDGVISVLTEISEAYSQYHNVRLDTYTYENNYEGKDGIYIIYEREETDKELAKRMKRAETAKKANKASQEMKKEKELKEYERLKKKYGYVEYDL